MSIPFFYNETIAQDSKTLVLNEETSKHVVQVLRMTIGAPLHVTDGKGNLFSTEIIDDHKKRTEVKIISSDYIKPPAKKITIAISLLKNTNRFEWFLEKATEIGISEIIPLICHRTEKQHFRFERMNGILISAMLQSQQAWLPLLREPLKFEALAFDEFVSQDKFIAHCVEEDDRKWLEQHSSTAPGQVILIGPEGDFTKPEIDIALKNNFIPVTLGVNRLRTETAGIVAATILQIAQKQADRNNG